MKKIWLILLCFFYSLSFAQQAPKSASNKKDAAILVEVAKVELKSMESSISTVGNLLANNSIVLKPEIAGKIEKIAFKEGEKIEKGKILIELDQTTTEANILDAKAKLKLAEQNLSRLTAVKEGSSAQQVDTAKANFLQAQANLTVAQAQQGKMVLKAPFSGYVGLSDVAVGQYVTVGQSLVTLVDAQELKLEFSLPERFALKLALQQEISFKIEGLEQVFKGYIYAINPEVDNTTHSISMRARVDNQAGLLKPGLFARVNIDFDNAQYLVVPEQAVFAQNGKLFVYKVVNEKAVTTEVKLGRRIPGFVEIIEGLSNSDTVIVAGQLKLRDGQGIEIAKNN